MNKKFTLNPRSLSVLALLNPWFLSTYTGVEIFFMLEFIFVFIVTYPDSESDLTSSSIFDETSDLTFDPTSEPTSAKDRN